MTPRPLFDLAPLHAYVSAHYDHPWWSVRLEAVSSGPDGTPVKHVELYGPLSVEEAQDVLLAVAATLLSPRPF